jgi:hypothetical protein
MTTTDDAVSSAQPRRKPARRPVPAKTEPSRPQAATPRPTAEAYARFLLRRHRHAG